MGRLRLTWNQGMAAPSLRVLNVSYNRNQLWQTIFLPVRHVRHAFSADKR